ncbi:MAG: class I SAM-dependent methyltransferase [Chloroflexi bacterium]|nr:class I SAM-dependent methyltransferase [Chloroflexota bacterium]
MITPPVCDYEGSDYQQRFWEEGGRAYEDQAEALALKKTLLAKGKHLLELGAGAGRNTPRYSGFERVTLVDYSTTQLSQAIERLGSSDRYRFIAADIYRLPFGPNSYDAATMIRTLHHFSAPEKALAQVKGCLADGAIFILEFANKRNLKALLRYLVGKQKWNPFARESVEFAELNFDFHPKSVKAMLKDLGFNIEHQVSVSYLRAGLFKRLPMGILMAKERVLQSLFSWTAYSPSIFLRAVLSGTPPAISEMQLFRCPACGHYPLEDTHPLITCDSCERSYPVKDGIYDFRVKE